ncbi:MAG: Uma2 family endonuclease [Cytophagaceae bacterium]|nr:Uma2 family endonuclease [Cytophagaceae bacterium]
METQAIEITEIETLLEETMSLNHSRLTYRLSVLLSAYEERYDIMPELELELTSGRGKPDVAIFPKLTYNWEEDIIRYTQPPITAIEILSPTQAFDALITKIRKIYFPAGVQSAWLVVPSVKAMHLFLPGQPVSIVTSGIFHDPVSEVSLPIDSIFR